MAFKKNYIPWNKGRKGDIPWNKGIKYSEEMKKNMGKVGKESPLYGRKLSEKTKRKISKSKKKSYKEHPEIIVRLRELRNKRIYPKKDSSIELKIQNLLSLLHLEYLTHKYMHIENGYQCDIFIPVQNGIPVKTIIEADGCYWHGCPICKLKTYKKLKERKILDKKRTKELQEKGFRVIRIWEHEIRPMKLNELKEIIS